MSIYLKHLSLLLVAASVATLFSCSLVGDNENSEKGEETHDPATYYPEDDKTGVAQVSPLVGIWYLHDGGLYRQYSFYEGGTYEAWEGTAADMKYTTGHFLNDENVLALTPDNGGDKAKVMYEVKGDILSISPTDDVYALDYQRLPSQPINPHRLLGTWKDGKVRITFKPDFTFEQTVYDPLASQRLNRRSRYYSSNNRPNKPIRGTFVLINDDNTERIYMRNKDNQSPQSTYSYRAKFTDLDGVRHLTIHRNTDILEMEYVAN